MLTDLSAFDTGMPWPPEDADTRERLEMVGKNRLLRDGKAHEVFDTWIKLVKYDENAVLEIVLNWHRLVSVKFADLLFGDPPELEVENADSEDELDELIEETGFWHRCYQEAMDVSAFGTGVFKPRLVEGERRISLIDPAAWFPIVARDDVQDVRNHVLAWEWEEGDDKYLRIEVHYPGYMDWRECEVQHKDGLAIIGVPVAEGREDFKGLGVDGFLVSPVHNLQFSDMAWGKDDYTDLDGVLQEIMVRFDLVAQILNTHSSPKLVLPSSALEKDENGEWVFRGSKDGVTETGDEKGATRYVTFDGQLAACYEEIDRLMRQAYQLMELSPALMGDVKTGQADSGTARRLLMIATAAKVARLQASFSPVIKQVLRNTCALAGVDTGAITLHWKDPIPTDAKDAAEVEAIKVTAGVTSLESSIRRLNPGMDEQGVTEEMERIATEKQQGAPPPPVVTLPDE